MSGARARSFALTDDVRSVLERAAFEGGVLKLPPERLDRSRYVAVNAALEALGGKWNRKVGGHVFADDAASALRELLDSGIVPAKNPDAFFPTPPAVVAQLLHAARLDAMPHGGLVLEPSAGDGAIALAVQRQRPDAVIHCVEIDAGRARKLSDCGMLHVWLSDFLAWDDDSATYDRIVMNPPFAVDDNATAWLSHVWRALDYLAPDGVLAAIVPVSFGFRDDRKHAAFRESIAGRSTFTRLAVDAFKESGTGVKTGVLVIEGESGSSGAGAAGGTAP